MGNEYMAKELLKIARQLCGKELSNSVIDKLVNSLFKQTEMPCPKTYKIIESTGVHNICLVFEWEYQASEGSNRHDIEKYLCDGFKIDGGLVLRTLIVDCDDFTGIYTLRSIYNGGT